MSIVGVKLDRLHAPYRASVSPFAAAGSGAAVLCDLMAGLGRKNGWTLAETDARDHGRAWVRDPVRSPTRLVCRGTAPHHWVGQAAARLAEISS